MARLENASSGRDSTVNSCKPDFKGNGILFLKNVLLYVLVTAPIFSFCLMGAQWLHILLAVLALSLPFLLLVGLLVSRFDGFSFDDEHQQIVKSFGRKVPYQSIMRFDLNETGRLLQVRMKLGILQRTSLAYALDAKNKPGLKTELLKRFPQSALRERRFVDWKSILIILSIVGCMTIVFHLYLYRNISALRAVPQQVVWETPKRVMKTFRSYSVGSLSIAAPGRFQMIGKDEATLQFGDPATREEIRFITRKQLDMPAPKALFIKYVSGIQDYYDVLNTVYPATVGVVPLMAKVLLLEGFDQVKIRKVTLMSSQRDIDMQKSTARIQAPGRLPGLHGFITQGEKGGRDSAVVFLTNAVEKVELQIVLIGPIAMDEKMVRGIVTSVHILPRK
jgi:hypothetical protein